MRRITIAAASGACAGRGAGRAPACGDWLDGHGAGWGGRAGDAQTLTLTDVARRPRAFWKLVLGNGQ